MELRTRFRQLRLPLLAACILTLSACYEASDMPRPGSTEHDDATVQTTLAALDDVRLPPEELADLYLDDAVILRPGLPVVRGREAIIELMKEQAAGPALNMTHRMDELTRFKDVLIVQGGVTGTAQPADGSGPFPFSTQNIIIFKRDSELQPKIWKVIYNAAPPETPDEADATTE
ncbi:MAG: hypothetical protein AAFP79_13715 [Pseudomonadota bacterium]